MAVIQRTSSIAGALEEHVRDMRVELERCERALAELRKGAAVAPRRRGAATMTPSDETLVAAIRGGAETATVIAKQIGVGHATVLKRLHVLEGSGVVAREGERHKTRWMLP